MKTKLLLSLFVSLCFVGQTQAADFVIADFEDKNVGDTYAMRAWSETDGNATIALDPTNEKNKVVNLITTNYDALLKMEVTLPAGRTLADYLTLNLDLYSDNDGTNYKKMTIFIDGTKVYEDTGYIIQCEMSKWTIKSYVLTTMGLDAETLSKSSFTLDIGVNTNSGNYYMDNITLIGKDTDPNEGFLLIDDFNNQTVGAAYDVKAWSETDGIATVAADPVDETNKVIHLTTSNYDALLQLDVTVPTGKSLADYSDFHFDIYSDNDGINYKKVTIYIDGEKKYEDSDYIVQSELSKWTAKRYSLASLNLTGEELAKSSFKLAFGINTDKGDYYLDNVKLKEIAGGTGVKSLSADKSINLIMQGNTLFVEGSDVAEIEVIDVKGYSWMAVRNASSIDLSALSRGIYVVRIKTAGKTIVKKIVK